VTGVYSASDLIVGGALVVSFVALGISIVSLYQTFFNRTPKAMAWVSSSGTLVYLSTSETNTGASEQEQENEESWDVMVGNIGRVPIFLTDLQLSYKREFIVNDQSFGYSNTFQNKNKIKISMIPVNEVRKFEVVVPLDEDRLNDPAFPDYRKIHITLCTADKIARAYVSLANISKPTVVSEFR